MMTIIEAINRTDNLNHNVYSQEQKIGWLSELDGKVKRDVIDTHEGAQDLVFLGYTKDTSLHTVLLVPMPYDCLYVHWLSAQIALANGEYDKYNASITLFNDEYTAFTGDYHRSHMPKRQGRRFLF